MNHRTIRLPRPDVPPTNTAMGRYDFGTSSAFAFRVAFKDVLDLENKTYRTEAAAVRLLESTTAYEGEYAEIFASARE